MTDYRRFEPAKCGFRETLQATCVLLAVWAMPAKRQRSHWHAAGTMFACPRFWRQGQPASGINRLSLREL